MEVQTIWSDDGIAIRLPEGEGERRVPPRAWKRCCSRRPMRSRTWSSARSRTRRCSRRASARTRPGPCSCRGAGPGTRTPLWQQRQRAADLLAVASRYGSFPILVETYRECLSDVFDLDALREVLGGVARREIAVHAVETPQREPIRQQPAVRLRRGLHVRRRHAAGGAAGGRAHARSRPAARAARPGGAARTARPGCAGGPRARPAVAERRPAGADRRRRA